MNETYPMPADGWVCFHCGERFTAVNAALDHFGHDPESAPACLFPPTHVRSELRRFRFVEWKLRGARHKLLGLRELTEGELPTSRDCDIFQDLLTEALDALS